MTNDNGKQPFDPSKHLTDLNPNGTARLYLEVKWRLAWLREEHPAAIVETTIHTLTDQSAIITARITLPNGAVGTGIGTADKAQSSKFSGRIVEKAETAALGRACATLGYGTQFSGGEFEDAGNIADGPVEGKPRRAPTAKPADAPATAPSRTDMDARPSTTGQHQTLHRAIPSVFGKDEYAAYEWVKAQEPEAAAHPTELHFTPLSMGQASRLIAALYAERDRRTASKAEAAP